MTAAGWVLRALSLGIHSLSRPAVWSRATALIAGLSTLYHLAALLETLAFARRLRRRPLSEDFRPPVTLLKPLARWDEEVRANLETFCRQAYPTYEVLVGISPGTDVPPETSLWGCRGQLRWVRCRPGWALNPKVNQLLQMAPAAAYDVWVLSDADIRVEADYLARVVAPLGETGVGAVTCLYRAREARTLPAAVEALITNTDSLPALLLARRLLGGLRFAFGATVALRREALAAIGGLEAPADYLADDYQIGARLRRAGYRVELADVLVDHHQPVMHLKDLLRHQVRWARTTRVCEPLGWSLGVLTYLTFWALVALVARGWTRISWLLVAGVGVFRLLESYFINAAVDGLSGFWRVAWVIPLKDLFIVGVWGWSFLGRQVYWGGRLYRVDVQGRLTPVREPVPGMARKPSG